MKKKEILVDAIIALKHFQDFFNAFYWRLSNGRSTARVGNFIIRTSGSYKQICGFSGAHVALNIAVGYSKQKRVGLLLVL